MLGAESNSLLRLAGEQRMNTEVRRRVFCVIMGADDCMDAAEKLMRLPLADKQDREVRASTPLEVGADPGALAGSCLVASRPWGSLEEAASSLADPRQKHDWFSKCLQGGRAHPLAVCGVI